MAGDQALARPATQAAIKPACRAVPYSANDRRADEARRATRPHSGSPQPSTYLSANTVSQSLRDGVMDPIRRLIPPWRAWLSSLSTISASMIFSRPLWIASAISPEETVAISQPAIHAIIILDDRKSPSSFSYESGSTSRSPTKAYASAWGFPKRYSMRKADGDSGDEATLW